MLHVSKKITEDVECVNMSNTLGCALCATLFLPHLDMICDLSPHRCTTT